MAQVCFGHLAQVFPTQSLNSRINLKGSFEQVMNRWFCTLQLSMKKDKLKNQQCYICGAPATSKEHVPPQCLFPEKKDIGTEKFRNNLITVPSCDLHNTRKAKDDEFLMAALSGYVGNNFLGFVHTQTKVARAIERNERFMDVFLKDATPKWIKNKSGNPMPILRGTPDFQRLTRCFENIAYGLYYHHFKKPFNGRIFCIIDFVTSPPWFVSPRTNPYPFSTSSKLLPQIF